MRSFVKIKSSQKGEITLSTMDIGESYHSRKIFRSKYVFNGIREIKILAKIPDLQYLYVLLEVYRRPI